MDMRNDENRGSSEPSQSQGAQIIWTDRGKKALDALVSAMSGAQPLVVATAEPGSGKSTYLKEWEKHASPETTIFRVSSRPSNVSEFMTAVAYAMSLSLRSNDENTFEAAVRLFLFDHDSSGKHAVLMIDDTEGLDPAAIDLLHRLADIKRKDRPLLRVLMTGSTSFLDRLRDAAPEGADSIAAVTIPGLTREASDDLIREILDLQSEGTIEIDEGACSTIYRESNGLPGRTKEIASRIAMAAMAQDVTDVDRRNIMGLMAGDEVRTDAGTGMPKPMPYGQRPPPQADVSAQATGRASTPETVASPETVAPPGAKTSAPAVDLPPGPGDGPRADMPGDEPAAAPDLDGVDLSADASATGEPERVDAGPAATEDDRDRKQPDDVGSAADLPKSIRDADDPRQLLRWAMSPGRGASPEASASEPTPDVAPDATARLAPALERLREARAKSLAKRQGRPQLVPERPGEQSGAGNPSQTAPGAPSDQPSIQDLSDSEEFVFNDGAAPAPATMPDPTPRPVTSRHDDLPPSDARAPASDVSDRLGDGGIVPPADPEPTPTPAAPPEPPKRTEFQASEMPVLTEDALAERAIVARKPRLDQPSANERAVAAVFSDPADKQRPYAFWAGLAAVLIGAGYLGYQYLDRGPITQVGPIASVEPGTQTPSPSPSTSELAPQPAQQAASQPQVQDQPAEIDAAPTRPVIEIAAAPSGDVETEIASATQPAPEAEDALRGAVNLPSTDVAVASPARALSPAQTVLSDDRSQNSENLATTRAIAADQTGLDADIAGAQVAAKLEELRIIEERIATAAAALRATEAAREAAESELAAAEAVRAEIANAANIVADLEAQEIALDARLAEKTAALDAAEARILRAENAEQEVDIAAARIATLATEDVQLTANIAEKTDALAAAETRLAEIQAQIDAVETESLTETARAEALRTELADLDKRLLATQAAITEAETSNAALTTTVAEQEARAASLASDVAEAETRLASLQEDAAALEAENVAAGERLATLDAQAEDAAQSIETREAELSAELATLRAEVTAAQEELTAETAVATARKEELAAELSQAEAALAAANTEAEAATARVATLNAEAEQTQAAQAAISTELASAQAAHDAELAALTDAQAAAAAERVQIENGLQAARDRADLRISEMAAEVETLIAQRDNVQNQRDGIQQQLASLSRTLTAAQSDAASSETLIREQEVRLAALNDAIAVEEAKLAGAAEKAQAELDEMTAQLDVTRQEFAIEQERVAALSDERAAIAGEIARLTEAQKSAEQRLASANVSAEEAEALVSRELAESRRTLTGVEQNVAEAEQALAALNGQRTDAENRIAELQATYDDATGQVDRAVTELRETNAALKARQRDLDNVASDIEKNRSELASLTEARNRLRREAQAAEQVLQTRNAELSAAQKALQDAREELDDRQSALDKADQRLKTTVTGLAAAEQDFSDVQNAIDMARTELDTALASRRTARAELEVLITATEEQRQALELAEEDKAAAQADLDQAQKSLTAAKSSVTAENARLEALRNQRNVVKTDVDQSLAEIAELNQSVDDAIAELTDVTGKINAAYDRVDREAAQLARLNAERLDVERRLSNAQTLLSSIEDKSGIELPETTDPTAAALTAVIPQATDTLVDRSDRTDPLVARPDSNAGRRDVAIVAKALKRAPGMSTLAPEKVTAIEARLVRGDCLTDILREETGRINRHTLAVLMRSLDVMCGS